MLIWRIGGVGDLLWCTAALPVLARQGFTVDFCTDARGRVVLANNPHVRRVLAWEDQRDPESQPLTAEENPQRLHAPRVQAWFAALAKRYDHAVALTWSVEGHYLWRQSDNPAEYWLPLAERQTDVNYTDEMVRRLAMPWLGGLLPELHASREERRWLRGLRDRHRGQKLLLWHIGGSSYNKITPQAPQYIGGLLEQIPNLVIYLLGDEKLEPFEAALSTLPEALRSRCWSVRQRRTSPLEPWTLRQQLLATSIADCVVGPESAITNAAACFDVPKVIFFSHSAPHNLSLYWWNAYPILPAAQCECAPCYRLIEGEPEECRVYEADLGWKTDSDRDSDSEKSEIRNSKSEMGRGRPVGAKCCVYLDHGRVFQTIGSILQGMPDRTCPACGQRKNRILEEGVYVCICGARFGVPRPAQRAPVEPQAMTCPICGGQTFDRVAIGWAHCACGVVSQDVRHLQAETYDAGYTAKYDHPEVRAKIRAVGERWLPAIGRALDSAELIAPSAEARSQVLPRRHSLLEIGYCLPEVLMLARERGWDVAGVEINPTAPNGDFPVFIGDFEALDISALGAGRYDAVFSNHVFEHFKRPLQALEKMVQLVRPGGLILIATPDAEHVHLAAHLHRKEHHIMWSAPALAKAAMQRGLDVIEVEKHDGPECGFVSWYDFHMLLKKPITTGAATEIEIGSPSDLALAVEA